MTDEVLAPAPNTVTLGAESYTVHKFCLAKSMRMLKMLTSMSDDAGLSGVVAVGRELGWIAALTEALPRIVAVADTKLFELLALTLLPNVRIFQVLEKEGSLDDEVKGFAKKLAMTEGLDIDKAIEIVKIGYDNMGLDSLQGNVKALLDKVAPLPATEPAGETSGSDSSKD